MPKSKPTTLLASVSTGNVSPAALGAVAPVLELVELPPELTEIDPSSSSEATFGASLPPRSLAAEFTSDWIGAGSSERMSLRPLVSNCRSLRLPARASLAASFTVPMLIRVLPKLADWEDMSEMFLAKSTNSATCPTPPPTDLAISTSDVGPLSCEITGTGAVSMSSTGRIGSNSWLALESTGPRILLTA